MPATTDPFPFVITYSPRKFVQSALYNGPSRNASKRTLSKIELLKDTRAMNDHWRVDHGTET